MEKRKEITMVVKVSVPAHLSAAHTRREVRSLINNQCNFILDPWEIRTLKITHVPTREENQRAEVRGDRALSRALNSLWHDQ
jgi:hypothetical protein